MPKRNLFLLLHPLFISSIILLLLNDFFLKYTFHNWFTGKISDFAGLFAFAVFLLSFFPAHKKAVLFFCGLFFIWWKSSLSQPAINIVNDLSPFTIGRTVDYSDLIALSVLPATYYFSFSRFNVIIPYRKISLNIICLVSLFAFCYTSMPRRIMYDYPTKYVRFYESFTTTKTEEEILQKLSSLQLKYSKDSVNYYRLSEADLYFREKRNDSVYQWKEFPNTRDSALYVRENSLPFYIIPFYWLDDDRLSNLEFRFEKGNKKNFVTVLSFETSHSDLSGFYGGKLKRKYKRHFKEFFRN